MTHLKQTDTQTCKDIVQDRCDSRMADLETLYKLAIEDSEAYDANLGNLSEYGLGFSYVAPETFSDQLEGYYRYQLSYGGPSQEIRFYVSPNADHTCNVTQDCGQLHHTPYRIEFWHMDWYDGASVDITNSQLAKDLYNYFNCY
jgi:hypothetical protein